MKHHNWVIRPVIKEIKSKVHAGKQFEFKFSKCTEGLNTLRDCTVTVDYKIPGNTYEITTPVKYYGESKTISAIKVILSSILFLVLY